MIERRSLPVPLECEIRESASGSRIVGYAAVYYDGTPGTEYRMWDDVYERIEPGAFGAESWRGHDVLGLFDHEPRNLLGRLSAGTLRLEADERGLRYEIDLGDTSVARDVREHLRRGDLRGSSFAFEVREGGQRLEEGKGRRVRTLTALNVYDVGPVVEPAYGGASASLRSAGSVSDELRLELEESFRSSRSSARERILAEATRLEELGVIGPRP